MKLSEQLKREMDRGMLGLNTGLFMGFDRLSNIVCNIQRRRYDLIGGDIGSGKTAFVDNSYLLNPYEYAIDNNINFNVQYFSLEIDGLSKITKLSVWKLWKDFGKMVDVNYVLSKGKNRIDGATYNQVLAAAAYFDQMQDTCLTILDVNLSPGAFYKIMMDYSEKHGTWIEDPKTHEKTWIPNDVNAYHIVIIDHIGLVSTDKNHTHKKAAIEQISHYAVWFRNKCGFSPVIVSQYNRTLQGTDRKAQKMLEPQLSDFKETAGTQEDANTVIALFNPSRYKIPNFRDYDIVQLKNRFRSAHILKNRDGDEGLMLPMNFFGEVGHFREMPLETGQIAKSTYEAAHNINKQFKTTANGTTSIDSGTVGYGQDTQLGNSPT